MSGRDDIYKRMNDLEGRLFALARSDAPSAAARRRALAALGVGAGVTAAASATHAAALGKAGALAGASAATGQAAKAALVMSVIKWAAVGALAGTVTLGGAVGVEGLTSTRAVVTTPSSRSESLDTVPVDRASKGAEQRPSVETPSAVPTPTATTAVTDRQPSPPLPSARSGANAAAAPGGEAVEPAIGAPRTVERGSSLEEEVTRIDRARSALSTGAPARALLELDEYDRRFPSGMMKPEATVVRIEAIAQGGDLAGARVLGRRFLSAQPTGGLAARVHKVIGE